MAADEIQTTVHYDRCRAGSELLFSPENGFAIRFETGRKPLLGRLTVLLRASPLIPICRLCLVRRFVCEQIATQEWSSDQSGKQRPSKDRFASHDFERGFVEGDGEMWKPNYSRLLLLSGGPVLRGT